jgi:nucleotide-binding universal stress UspA family protein
MKTIILATDFSSAALNAANYAADMAVAINADLRLLTIPNFPIYYNDVPPITTPEEVVINAEETLNELKKQLERKTGNKIKIIAEVRMGTFFNELKTFCDSIHPFAVVMGSQGLTNAERLFFGSHTVFAMKHLMWPILAIPRGAKFSSIKKIGLACDFEKVVDKTPVDEIEKLVKNFNARLYVINTGTTKAHEPEMIFQSGLLEVMLEGLQPEYYFTNSHDIDEGIMDFCEKNNIDLLIVMPKRHTLLDKLIHSSHTKQLILHSHVPVMALHS